MWGFSLNSDCCYDRAYVNQYVCCDSYPCSYVLARMCLLPSLLVMCMIVKRIMRSSIPLHPLSNYALTYSTYEGPYIKVEVLFAEDLLLRKCVSHGARLLSLSRFRV